ncbi:hypothetical protein BS78_08G067200 [Paspalum vaginatum]|nr:hypothetical protein BS78_08G067200 [Paspalum vaginatum]
MRWSMASGGGGWKRSFPAWGISKWERITSFGTTADRDFPVGDIFHSFNSACPCTYVAVAISLQAGPVLVGCSRALMKRSSMSSISAMQ